MKLILTFITLTLLSSCSSYVNMIYRDFENQERMNADVDSQQQEDGFDQFRKVKRRTSAVYNQPSSKLINSNNQKVLEPQVKRQYKDEKVALKRYTASDLTDTGTDGSLWAGSDPNAFLFSTNRTKSSGDIVQVNITPKLKDEITMELKRAFPDNPYETKSNKESATNDPKAKTGEVADKKTAETAADVKDKISTVVVEEINREHLLIKGRKNVLFKNRKRMIEVQALVSRKDIGDDDTISSDSILESNVSVVR